MHSRVYGFFQMSKQIQFNNFEDHFKDVGSTITFLNKNYIRPLMFDVDCLCARTQTHIQEQQISNIINTLKERFNEVKIKVYKLNCRFHIYTNAFVSITAHYAILKHLPVENNFIVEIPDTMPLPYSTKDGITMYTPCEDGDFLNNSFFNASFMDILQISEMNNYLFSCNSIFWGLGSSLKQQYIDTVKFDGIITPSEQQIIFKPEFLKNIISSIESLPKVEKEFDYCNIVKKIMDINLCDFFKLDQFYYAHLIVIYFIKLEIDKMDVYDESIHQNLLEKFKCILDMSCYTDVEKQIANNIIDGTKDVIVKSFSNINCETVFTYIKMIIESNTNIINAAEIIHYFLKKQASGIFDSNGILTKPFKDDFSKVLFLIKSILLEYEIVNYVDGSDVWRLYTGKTFKNIKLEEFKFLIMYGFSKKHIEQIISVLNQSQNAFKIENTFDTNHFISTTNYGLFNNFSNSYFLCTPFFKATKVRNYILKPISFKQEKFINISILEHLEITKRVFDTVKNDHEDLYFDTFVHKAIKELEHDQISPAKFNNLIDKINIKNMSKISFIVDYYCVDIRVLAIFNKLLKEIHNNDITNVEVLKTHEFCMVFENIECDDSFSSHLEKVMKIFKLSKAQASLLTLIAVYHYTFDEYPKIAEDFEKAYPGSEYLKKHEWYQSKAEDFQIYVKTKIDNYISKFGFYEKEIAAFLISLLFSFNFNFDKVENLLAVCSSSFVNFNYNKRIILFSGRENAGKSRLFDIFFRLFGNSGAARVLDFNEAQSRADLASLYFVVFINEVKQLHPSEVKSITGSDAVASKVFFAQRYELKNNRGSLFGCINTYPEFVPKPDLTAINRLYCLEFIGVTDAHVKNALNCVTEFKFPNNIFRKLNYETESFSYLMYLMYMQQRNEDGYITYKDNPETIFMRSITIQQIPIFNLMYKCGIVSHPKCCISGSRIFAAIENYNLKHKNTKGIVIGEFLIQFKRQFGKDLRHDTVIEDFQESSFLKHYDTFMKVIGAGNQSISRRNLNCRVRELYSAPDLRDSALALFKHQNEATFNGAHKKYFNIKFTNVKGEKYTPLVDNKTLIDDFESTLL